MKKVLLIADDEEMNRRIISRFLKNEYEIVEAEDGKEALELLKTRHVDALLLDIIMPEMDGLEVLRAMRTDASLNSVAVLVATSTKEKTERTALSMGADDVVSKPYDPVVIRKRLENILALKSMTGQKDMLLTKDMKGMLKETAQLQYEACQQIYERLVNFANILQCNGDNPQLTYEICEDIKIEAKKIVEMCEERK